MDTPQPDLYLLQAFRALLQNSPDMIFVKDPSLTYVAASASFARLVGHENPAELIGKTDFDLFSRALAEKYTLDDRRIFTSGTDIVDCIEPLPDQQGRKSYSSTSKHLIRDESGAVIGMYGVARDVTAQIELEAERESSRLSRQMFDVVLEADLTQNRMLRIEGVNGLPSLTLESSFSEMTTLFVQHLVHPDDAAEYRRHYDRATLLLGFDKGMHAFTHITRLMADDGTYHWTECRTRVYHSRVADTLRVITYFTDVHAETTSRQRLQKRAVTDALTGLFNRACTLDQISDFLSCGDCHLMHALFFIDLDGFKQINDVWGHQFGDKVLEQVADRLRQTFREDDIVGRVGGDEFIVFLKNVPCPEAARERALEIVRTLPLRRRDDDDDVFVTCSVGVTFCRPRDKVELLYEQADRAMYYAKQQGKNQIAFFDELE